MYKHLMPHNLFHASKKQLGILLFIVCALSAQAQNKKNPASVQTAATFPEMACSATEFKALAYTINEVKLREERAKDWLVKFGKTCPLDQIELIMQNQAVWLGTAQTPLIMASIESIYREKKAAAIALEKAAAAAGDKK